MSWSWGDEATAKTPPSRPAAHDPLAVSGGEVSRTRNRRPHLFRWTKGGLHARLEALQGCRVKL
jgi:hypothetical protein